MWEKLQYLDNEEWKQLSFRDEIFTVYKRHKMTFLKVQVAILFLEQYFFDNTQSNLGSVT